MRSIKLRVLPILLAALAVPAHAASELGQLDFPTSGSPAAQAHFVRGVAALHSFFYDEAADFFREAQKADPGFALAYWGEAMTYNHPIWSEQDRDAALAALARLAPTPAERAAKAPTEREKAWLAAVETLYGEGEKPARDAAYAEAMRKLHERYPDDVEAASFYTLSLIGPALTGPTGDARDRPLIRAAAILEELYDRAPQHPGVLHYMIHAYDDPLHAPLGLRAARLYAKTAPAAHHALHMPSHIFVQIGDWPSAVASNENAWAASVNWVKRREHPIEKQDFHSLSWLLYAYAQQGRLGKARETLETARAAGKVSDNQRVAFSVREMEARYLVETRSWRKDQVPAGAAEAGGASSCHGGGALTPGQGNTVLLYATGLGAARSGDLDVAEQAADKLRKIANAGAAPYRGGAPAGILADQIAGLVALKKGNAEEGLKLLAAAAEAESRLPPPSGPPDPMKPSHELYGEALLDLGRVEEAGKQFEISLLRTPNRPASLLGAARVAVKRGDGETARRYYGQLAEIWKQADAGFPELAEVKGYLEGVRTAASSKAR
jgi:tetratricopeptide (TPR) repeat protein